MSMLRLLLALILSLNSVGLSTLASAKSESSAASKDLTQYVNPFIGTGGHGHAFPGASLPFGMVQLSPDTRLTGWDGCSGYHYSDSAIYGFSHTHLSGTGISDYGDILFMPALPVPPLTETTKQYSTNFSHQDETANPGYYRVKLSNKILVELTTTARVGFHRYSFPTQTETGAVILDLKHRDRVLDSYLRIFDQTHIVGFRRSTGWAKNQVVYFAAEFSKPFESTNQKAEQQGTDIKAIFKFSQPRQLLIKVGISSVSIDGARKNLATEISHWDFDKIRSEASSVWNRELNKIQVSGGSESQLTTFYTALYHALLTPNLFMDVDGSYLGRDFKIHKAEGFDNYTVFSLWDTFRAAHPLYTLIDQKRTKDFINTFLAQYQQGGRLPVWELAANETDTMIGYHSVSIIADAVAKGVTGFDKELAFQAMKHSAEQRHHGLDSYIDNGYIAMETERESVSKTLEYAYDDWCIAKMAKTLQHEADFQRYMQRAQFYKNVFDTQVKFVRPRSNGGWLSPFEPREVNSSFTEANSWQYSFFVPQDISGLIHLMGGEAQFAQKLDELFSAESQTTGREQADITGLIGQYAHGNEPSHHVAYLYDYVRQPWKTQQRVRQIMDEFYKSDPAGLIGNEDCGQMSAWYVLSAAGFYPVTPGSTIYAIGTPLFPEYRFNFESGKSFVIKANNVSSRNFFIQSAILNGKPYHKSFLSYEDLINGGELVFEMGDKRNTKWATEPPVSQIATAAIISVPTINSASKTFKTEQEIRIAGESSLYYTMDGTEPNSKSKRYNSPFTINGTTTVKARAVGSDGRMSKVATASFIRMPHSWNITLNTKYSALYTGGGEQALIDGIRGTTNFSGGAWQGYQGRDLIAVVDLGQSQKVSKLGAGFLQDVGSWILMPTSVDFEVSADGKSYVHVLSIKNTIPDQNYDTIIKDLVGSIEPRSARYIRVTAHNYGKLPSWHAGAGGDAWIFADEILIE